MADFTIVTPVLNQVSTIEACIQSVAIQKVDVEHIIIDGGSTDGTIDIVKENEHLLSFWVSEKDGGQSAAINKGLNKAIGTFFNWLNADDVLTKGALSTVLEAAKPDTLAVAGLCRHVNDNGQEFAVGSAKVWDSIEATLGNYSMGQPSLFYRTSSVQELGGLNENLHLCMDMDLWFRFLLDHGQNRIVTINKVLSVFLLSDFSKSTQLAMEMTNEKYGLYHALASSFDLPNCVIEFFNQFPIPKGMQYNVPDNINPNLFLANFCWHLMLRAYQSGNIELTKAYFELIKSENRLSKTELLLWKTRIAAGKILS